MLIFLILLDVLGVLAVIATAKGLSYLPWFRRQVDIVLFISAHTLIVLLLMALSPLYVIWMWGSPEGDLYLPYCFVPGFHIYFSWLIFLYNWNWNPEWLALLNPFPNAVLFIVVGPGLLGIVVGAFQWLIIGAFLPEFLTRAPIQSIGVPLCRSREKRSV